MKILINKNDIAINQIAVQSWIAGMLSAIGMVSFVWLLVGFTNWLDGSTAPVVELLSTILLFMLVSGRINSAERYGETIKTFIKEKS